MPAGIHHILIGPDHLLFLVGLLLLGGTVRQLALVVTAFTVAHSITLSLAALNLVTPPARIIEPAIALSIVYVGADNLLVARRPRHARLDRVRVRLHPRLRLRQRAARDGPAAPRARLVAVLVQPRRRDRPAAGRRRRRSALAALRSRSEAAGRRLAFAGSIVVIAAGAFWFVQRVFFPGGDRMRSRTIVLSAPCRGRRAVAGGRGLSGAGADAPKVVEVEKLKDNLYMLKGGGGNTAVFVDGQRRHGRRHEEPGLGPADPRQDQGADAASR